MWCGCTEQWTGSGAGFQLDRRQAIKALAALLTAGCGATVTSAHRDDAQRLAQESTSVDLHSHPGMFRSSTTSLEGHLERMTRATEGLPVRVRGGRAGDRSPAAGRRFLRHAGAAPW